MYKFLLCGRYLKSRMIAIVSIISVMIGVATMIVVNSVMDGFQTKMRDRLHGILADVIIEAGQTDGMTDWRAWMEMIKEKCGDKVVAMTPVVETVGLLEYDVNKQHMSRFAKVIGIDPAGRNAVGDFSRYLLDPENQKSPSFKLTKDAIEFRADMQKFEADPRKKAEWDNNLPSAIVGYQMAAFRPAGSDVDQLTLGPGMRVGITVPNTSGHQANLSRRSGFIVSDHFKSDMSEYDSMLVFVPIEEVQMLRGMNGENGGRISSIQIKLRDYNKDSASVLKTIKEFMPEPWFFVETWEQKQTVILQAVKVEEIMLNIILFFIIANAGFGILSVFYMTVVEKTKDIGIMKALGASDRGVMGVFLGYGCALGIFGCLLGGAIGVGFTLFLNPIERLLTRLTGYEIFPRDIYYFKEIPVQLSLPTVFWVCLAAILIAVISSVMPARQAARLKPVEALRYE